MTKDQEQGVGLGLSETERQHVGGEATIASPWCFLKPTNELVEMAHQL
jgi:hypothetical protein